MLDTIFWWAGYILILSLMLATIVLLQWISWTSLWKRRDDWRMFVSYIMWRWKEKIAEKNRAAIAATMRRWARDVCPSAYEDDEEELN